MKDNAQSDTRCVSTWRTDTVKITTLTPNAAFSLDPMDADRERVLIYSEPYLENRLILVGRQGSDVSVTSLAALAGNRIALVAGYAYGEAAKAKEGPIIVGSIKSGPHRNRTGPTQVRYLHVQDLAGDGSEPVSRERENEGWSEHRLDPSLFHSSRKASIGLD